MRALSAHRAKQLSPGACQPSGLSPLLLIRYPPLSLPQLPLSHRRDQMAPPRTPHKPVTHSSQSPNAFACQANRSLLPLQSIQMITCRSVRCCGYPLPSTSQITRRSSRMMKSLTVQARSTSISQPSFNKQADFSAGIQRKIYEETLSGAEIIQRIAAEIFGEPALVAGLSGIPVWLGIRRTAPTRQPGFPAGLSRSREIRVVQRIGYGSYAHEYRLLWLAFRQHGYLQICGWQHSSH